MGRKRPTTEQIIGHLREAEVLFAQGMKTAAVKMACDGTQYCGKAELVLLLCLQLWPPRERFGHG